MSDAAVAEVEKPPEAAVGVGAPEPEAKPAPADVPEAVRTQLQREAEEALAKEFGWVPEDHHTGDRPWVDARTFILNERKISRKYRDDLREIRESMGAIQAHHERTIQAETERHRAELAAAKRDAVKEGDVERVEAIDKELDELRDQGDDVAAVSSAEERKVREWRDENPWYKGGDDGKADPFTRAADALANALTKQGLSVEEVLQRVDAEIGEVAREAVRLGKPDTSGTRGKPEGDAKVEGGTRTRSATTGHKFTYDDLPEDYRRICDKFVRTVPGFTKEQYVADLVTQGVLK